MATSDSIIASIGAAFDEDEKGFGSPLHSIVAHARAEGYVTPDTATTQKQTGAGTLLSALSTTAAVKVSPAFLGTTDTVAVIGGSGDPHLDGSLRGVKWLDGAITYSDPDAPSDYQAAYSSDQNRDGVSAQNQGFSQLTAQQMQAVHFALSASIYTQPLGAPGFSVEGFTNLDIEYAGPGVGASTIRLANSSDPSTAYAFYPGTFVNAGDVWLGTSLRTTIPGSYAWFGVLHELGHSLGLKHGHEDFGLGALPAEVNSLEFSLMTYSTYIGQSPVGRVTFEQWGAPQTYMMLDIAALQHLYGADYTTNSTDTIYTWNPASGATFVNGNAAIQPGANRIFETIWDGGGTDTYDLSNYTTGVSVDLGPGDYSVFSTAQLANLGGGPNGGLARGNVFNALQWNGDPRSLIEIAIGGAGADVFRGNIAANRLAGNAGNDTLFGEDGNDVLDGGLGTDVLYGDAGDDVLIYDAADASIVGGSGNDTLVVAQSGVTMDLAAIPDNLIGDIEVIDLGARGNTLALGASDVLALSSTSDTLRIDGGAGDQVISGNGRDWVRLGEQVIGSNVYYAYTRAGATLLLDRDITSDIAITFPVPVRVINDVNLDGRSDIVWRGPAGQVETWLAQGTGAPVKLADGAMALGWSIVDTHGDYNGDGRSDILWRHSDGTIDTWLMNGDGTHGAGVSAPVNPSRTLIDGHGDYNGDGKSDLLWREPNGEVRSWLIDGTLASEVSHFVVPLAWSIVDTHGDYNADGRNDVLWRHTDGTIATWLMNGAAPFVAGLITATTVSWTLIDGHGDYNGDGKSDLLWRTPTGEVRSWLINDGTLASEVSHFVVPREWSVVDTQGDYNADGRNDVLWRHSDGTIATWLMNGNAPPVAGLITPSTVSWTLIDGHSDYNGDGKSDLLWRAADGEARVWLIDNSALVSQVSYGTLPLSWNIAEEMGPAQMGDAGNNVLTGNDLNADGRSDLVWRGPAGQVETWLAQGASAPVKLTEGAMALGWSIVDTHGDYNGDGRSDILWRHTDGTIDTWLMNGDGTHGAGVSAPVNPSRTLIDGHGDYNGDGKSDLLWREPNGEVRSWLINDGTLASEVSHFVVPLAWSIVDTHGDYNADGRNDVLWRHTDGTIATWLMNGAAPFVAGLITATTVSWTLIDGHGDYNGDGKSDLLWRTPTGEVRSWLINDGTLASEVSHFVVPLAWSVVDTQGDYNADGRNDVLWRHTDGTIATWLMNGNAPPVAGLITPSTVSWTLIDGHSDYNGDGKSDLLWRAADGEARVWLIDNSTLVSQVSYGTLPLSWNIADEIGPTQLGDAGNNVLTGTLGANLLRGLGGADTLSGNGGGDRFLFDTPLDASNVDSVVDFKSGQDKLVLSDVIFANLAAGPLSAAQLVVGPGAQAQDANDRILYNTATGQLSYDADGSGAGAAIAFATLFGQPALSATDIAVVAV